MTIKHFLLNFFYLGGGVKMCDKMHGNFCLYFENSRKGPILRLQMRAKEMFNDVLQNPHVVDTIAAGFSVAIPHQSILYGT